MGSSPGTCKTTIINKALRHLHIQPLTSPDDISEAARVANDQYDCARRSALRSCDWNFATDNVGLTLIFSADNPAFDASYQKPQDLIPGWLYCYEQPINIRIRKLYTPVMPDSLPLPYIDRTVHDRIQAYTNDIKYRLMRSPLTKQPAIMTNLASAWCEFTADITDESQFDDMFVDGFALALACEMCMPLTGDKELLQIVEQGFTDKMGEAKRKNGGEGTERLERASAYEDCRN